MPLRRTPWERQLAVEAFTLGKTQELGSLGRVSGLGRSGSQRGGGVPLVPAWCVSYLWLRVGWKKHSS